MSSSLSPRRRRLLASSPATDTTTTTSSPQPKPAPIVREAHAYLQRFQSTVERRQPAASSDSSSSSSSSSSRPIVRHIPPIDTRTLSYSNDDDETTSVDRYQANQDDDLQQVLSNESTLISEMTGGTGLSSPQEHQYEEDEHPMEHLTNTTALVVATSDTAPTSWWRNMVQQLEHRHDIERKHWQENLQIAETKKSQYKSELRDNIANQLKWLEDRMTSPHHMIPHSHSSSSSSSHDKWKQKATMLQELMQLTEQQHGVEKTEWDQKIVSLESTLKETREKYTKQLETAFAHQEYMEGLVQQWKETADGAIEAQRKLQQTEQQLNGELQTVRSELQKERLRNAALQETRTSKSRDGELKRLQETLSIERKRTEDVERKCRLLQSDVQSQAQEIVTLTSAKESERAALQTKLEKLQAQCQEQVQQIPDLSRGERSEKESLQKQIEELQVKCQQMHDDRQKDFEAHIKQVQQLQKEFATVQEEASTFRAQAADFSEAATTAKSQCTNLQRSLAESPMARLSPVVQHRVEWDDKLDRALAERDLYQQEVTALKTERAKHIEQLQHSREFVVQYEQLAKKHALLIERLAAFEHHSDQRFETTQIESMRQENLNLQEALTNEADRHAQEVRKLKADLLQYESEVKLCEIKIQQGAAACNSEYETEISNLRAKLQQTEAEMDERNREASARSQATIEAMQSRISQLEQQIKSYDSRQETPNRMTERIRVLEEELSNRPVAALQRLAEMSEQHTRDQRALIDQLDAAASENKNLQQQTESLSKSLADLRNLHSKSLNKYDRLLFDKERLQSELAVFIEERDENRNQENSPPEYSSPSVDQSDEKLIDALSSLQNDVREVQQQLKDATQQQGIERTFLERFRSDLSDIQSSLNDAVVELTLETDALLESREAIKTVASDASSLMGERDGSSKLRFLEQQQQLLTEFGELRDNFNAAASARSAENQSCLKDLINDIRSKEAALSAAQTELRYIKEKLQSEIAARQKVEGEIEVYADQADAYEEQLMTLQYNNTTLAKKLHIAGLKIDASLTTMPNYDDEVNSAFATPHCLLKPSNQRDESLSVLDEALAMAENMASLVRDGEKDGNFMDMLEAMSNLMETKQTIGVSSPVSPKRMSTPPAHSSNISFDETISDRTLSTAPSSPVSPLKRHRKVVDETTGSIEIVHEESIDEQVDGRSARTSNLATIVEQLYARCQMLERERAEMMETTLELLEATKEANTAEIDAVLAGARRRAVDDILDMHRASKKDQERVLKRIMMNQSRNVI